MVHEGLHGYQLGRRIHLVSGKHTETTTCQGFVVSSFPEPIKSDETPPMIGPKFESCDDCVSAPPFPVTSSVVAVVATADVVAAAGVIVDAAVAATPLFLTPLTLSLLSLVFDSSALSEALSLS